MGMLAGRRDELRQARTQVVNRLHRLLLELLPGGAKKFLSARQARTLIATVKPRDLAGKTRCRLAAGLTGELEAIDKKTRALDKELTGLVTARGSTLTDLHGIVPSGAARLLADVAGARRFARRDRFASWNGTAPRRGERGATITPAGLITGGGPPKRTGGVAGSGLHRSALRHLSPRRLPGRAGSR
jgi:transposase